MEYSLVAPMPGLVARVVVEIGQAVEAEQELCVLNCMKTCLLYTSSGERAMTITGPK